MEIQQQEKEALAAYVHWFKTEAKRCNFTNDAATIRIFIKCLKNAQSLATHIYEKGPHMLSSVVSKVEKLNAVLQLTATITPPSTVNMMSNDEDRCFQCQEYGHIARNFPNIRCFECDKYGHIVTDCPHILQEPQQNITNPNHMSTITPDLAPATAMRTGTGEVIPGHSHISTDTTAQVVMICIEVVPGHNIGIITTTPEAVHNAPVLCTGVTAIYPTMIHHTNHTTDHPHIEAHPPTTPEIDGTHIHVHLTSHQDEIHIGHTHTPVDHEANHITRRAPE